MQYASAQGPAVDATRSPPQQQQQQQQQQQPSAVMLETTFPSSTSSPKSQMTSVDVVTSQISESTLASQPARELTPPSSVASSQELRVESQKVASERRPDDGTTPSPVTGRKRTASGQVKDTADVRESKRLSFGLGQQMDTSLATGNTNLVELSQQLKTKLAYAMVKVQHGWQKHSLDEIESIASQSPRSNLLGAASHEFQSMISPRAAMAAGKRQHSNASSSSDHSFHQQPVPSLKTAPSPAILHQRKALAPPAAIVAGNRRRPMSNTFVDASNSAKPSPRSSRPHAAQRTPSQNAAMEADAVETLLFMSASPSTSVHFPSHMSAYSPTSQAFSAQNSPLKTHFSKNERNYPASATTYSPRYSNRRVQYEDKTALIDRLLHNLDDEESDDLDRAMQIMEQHRAAKLSA